MEKKDNFNVTLPRENEHGYYEIRLESIGGLGANLCGKLLGELGAAYLGLNAAAFSSYGSEKRGGAVKSFIRFSKIEREILHNSPIVSPDMLVVFHAALSKTLPILAGVSKDSVVVINTPDTPSDARDSLKIHASTVCCVDALGLALKTKSRVNMVILGAIAKASGFIPLDAVKEIVRDTLGKKYPAMLENNLNGIDAGYNEAVIENFCDDKYEFIPYKEQESKWGYKNAAIGGNNYHIGSTVSNDLSPSREGFIPLFLPEKCIHCGLCDSTCPDMVFQFIETEENGKRFYKNRGLDYHHCKGCLRCVDICPVEALVVGKEAEHKELKYFIRNKDLIAENIDFSAAGADAYITSESYLDEKRADGGLL